MLESLHPLPRCVTESEMFKFHALYALLVGMLCVSLSGCASSMLPTVSPEATAMPSPAPTRRVVTFPTPALGWTLYSRSTYQIALPDTWQVVELDPANLKAAIEVAQSNNPPLADSLRALLESGQYQSLLFYATENAHASIVANVTIVRVVASGATNIQEYARAAADALPNIARGARLTSVRAPLRVNGLEAAEIVYDLPLIDAHGELQLLRGIQYLFLLDSGDVYVVTVTGDAAKADEFMPLAQQIAQSFVAVPP